MNSVIVMPFGGDVAQAGITGQPQSRASPNGDAFGPVLGSAEAEIDQSGRAEAGQGEPKVEESQTEPKAPECAGSAIPAPTVGLDVIGLTGSAEPASVGQPTSLDLEGGTVVGGPSGGTMPVDVGAIALGQASGGNNSEPVLLVTSADLPKAALPERVETGGNATSGVPEPSDGGRQEPNTSGSPEAVPEADSRQASGGDKGLRLLDGVWRRTEPAGTPLPSGGAPTQGPGDRPIIPTGHTDGLEALVIRASAAQEPKAEARQEEAVAAAQRPTAQVQVGDRAQIEAVRGPGTQPEQPETIRQITHEIGRMAVDPDRQTAEIQLVPEHLGRLRLEVRLTGDKVHVAAYASSAHAQAALEAGSADLRQSLEDMGYQLGSFQTQVDQNSQHQAHESRHSVPGLTAIHQQAARGNERTIAQFRDPEHLLDLFV